MTLEATIRKLSPVGKSILATAKDMLAGGVMDKRGFDRVMHHLDSSPRSTTPSDDQAN
jgi:hypothetical protein